MIWKQIQRLVCFTAIAFASGSCGSLVAQQGPAGLWIWDAIDPAVGGSVIRELDETIPAAGMSITEALFIAPEIEFGHGNFYNSGSNGVLQVVDASSGLITETVVLDFGSSFDNVVTGMEFVGNTLYGGTTTTGSPFAPSTLSIIDVDSGLVSSIGMTGIFGPVGGLAFNNGTMYAIEAGGANPTDLYTIDLTSGVATSVGLTGVQLTGLEFGADGILYALGRGSNEDELFSLDPLTGNATLIGIVANEPGGGSITSTFVVPEPSSSALLCSGLLFGLLRRRRWIRAG